MLFAPESIGQPTRGDLVIPGGELLTLDAPSPVPLRRGRRRPSSATPPRR